MCVICYFKESVVFFRFFLLSLCFIVVVVQVQEIVLIEILIILVVIDVVLVVLVVDKLQVVVVLFDVFILFFIGLLYSQVECDDMVECVVMFKEELRLWCEVVDKVFVDVKMVCWKKFLVSVCFDDVWVVYCKEILFVKCQECDVQLFECNVCKYDVVEYICLCDEENVWCEVENVKKVVDYCVKQEGKDKIKVNKQVWFENGCGLQFFV